MAIVAVVAAGIVWRVTGNPEGESTAAPAATESLAGVPGRYDTDPRRVFRQEFTTWPFTVGSGQIGCQGGGAVTFAAQGRAYALNGTAREFGWPAIDPIWRDDPETAGLKMNISEVLDAALRICR
ncbi:DUF2511 domain-containing protein [Actinacidiphila glaucinigra]|uniref:DUF2511 domain-containing protein n=1 Tax=Actinacidiphila glaucinigra TaxID=235986 RepID=UPI0035DC2732